MTDTNYFSVKNDDFSIISDITENTSKSSEKNKISKIDLTIIFDANLQKMKIIKLKNKCFINSIESVSKFTKQELVNILTSEFELLWVYYTSLNLSELRNICKTNYINGVSTKKKDDIISVIMVKNSTCDSMLFLGKNTLLSEEIEEPHFVKPTIISHELASFLEKPPRSEMSRTEVIRDINNYIRINNLQDKENGRKINPDTKLANLLKLNESDELTYFNIQRYLSLHLISKTKPDSLDHFMSKLNRELKEHEEETQIQKEKQLKRELKKQKELEKIKQQEIEEETERLKQEEERQTQLDLIKQLEEEEEDRIQKELEKIKQQDIKNKKQVIPKNIKVIVWNHYIGENIIHHRCLCCKKVLISKTSFHVGHVISEKAGGTHEINNLRPICASCNHSMGSENMVDFVIKYGLYIG